MTDLVIKFTWNVHKVNTKLTLRKKIKMVKICRREEERINHKIWIIIIEIHR